MFHDITVNDFIANFNQQKYVWIDVRSPSEYKEATIPGSINIPLFNDEERDEIGTLYKKVSVQAAKERGLEIASHKLPALVKEFSSLERKIMLFCWRGGMRSKTVATVLDLMGIETIRLQGGLRAYREWVIDKLATINFEPKAFVINGYTGAGKTVILRRLAQEGYPVLDLEGMANHRGSIFGQIGLEPNNQRMFESYLVGNVMALQHSPYVLIEAESKRIGKVILPTFLMEKKQQGIQIFVDMPVEERVRHILDDYRPWEHQQNYMEAFHRIKSRIHTPVASEIEGCLEMGDFSSAVKLLLEYYYDPRYEYTAEQYSNSEQVTVRVQNVEEAVQAIKAILTEAKVI